MFVIHFFDCNVSRKNLLFVSSKKQTACQLNTFNSNWWLNSLRETAADIVLDVSENSHGNVYSEVLSEVVAYQHRVYWFFQIKIFPRFSEHRKTFLGVICKGSCSALINAVMKYLNFCSRVSKLENATCKINRTLSQ